MNIDDMLFSAYVRVFVSITLEDINMGVYAARLIPRFIKL